jgi:4-nitrophenyl phosphatase
MSAILTQPSPSLTTPSMPSPTPSLKQVRGYVFDVDGTLALADKQLSGYQVLPGAAELVSLLQGRGVPCVAFTNGSTKTPAELSKALVAVGIHFDEHHTLTPVSVAVDHFKTKGYRRILVLGGEGVWRPLEQAGFEVVRAPERADDVDAVFIGWYPQFGLADLDAACRAVWAGAALYTVSTAPYVASREGRTLGISGALAAAVHSVTGKRAVIVGKPSVPAIRCVSRRLGVAPAQLAIVGDDATLELAMAHRAGAFAVAVHTGLGSAADFAALPANRQPHLSLSGVDQLLALLT